MSVFRRLLISQKGFSENIFMVTFVSDGQIISQNTVRKNEKAVKPADPVKANHTFTGWMLNGETYDFNNDVTGNIELVARWIITVYTQTGTATVQLLLYRPVNTGLFYAFFGVTVVFEKPFREILSCECNGEVVRNEMVMNTLQLYFNNTGFRHLTGQEIRMTPDRPSIVTGILSGTVSWKASGYF